MLMHPLLFRLSFNKPHVFLKVCRNKKTWHEPTGVNTGIMIHNRITKNKVPLIIQDNVATWYSCGPTVYDSAHIGHASSYVRLDIIRRILKNYFNINLITCMGITDIDDKIIKKCLETKSDMLTLTKRYENEFWKNLADLNVQLPDFVMRVSENVPEIIDFITELFNKNMCYKASDDSVYFDTEFYGKYGKFVTIAENELHHNEKKRASDFALWKVHKEGEPYWEAEWSKGRPGWHIECSAMASKLFGKHIDIHTGGIDLMFPHHENEEAQSCAFHNCDQWVNYWIHTGHLIIDKNVKMSKSLKNTISINEILEKYNCETFRMVCLILHYRTEIEFNDEVMINAKTIVDKIKFFLEYCKTYCNEKSHNLEQEEKLMLLFKTTKVSVDMSLRNDFDTSECIIDILKLIKKSRKLMESSDNENTTHKDFRKPLSVVLISQYIKDIFNIFGLSFKADSINNGNRIEVINTLVNFRSKVRLNAIQTKNTVLLKECDVVRDVLKLNNVIVSDSSKSSSWISSES